MSEIEEAKKKVEEENVERSPGPIIPDDDSPAIPISAGDLVSADKDRPVADVKISEEDSDESEETVEPSTGKKRGRKKMSDEEKAQAKVIRDAIKAGKAPPDFNKVLGGQGNSAIASSVIQSRNYFAEACEIFIPVSFAAGKMLGDHWGIKIKEAKIVDGKTIEPPGLDFTEEQKQYLQNMARWLEYEQFPPMNARMGFIIASCAYMMPRFKQEPTPKRLKDMWEKAKHFFAVVFRNKK